jgi:hypothetical protein
MLPERFAFSLNGTDWFMDLKKSEERNYRHKSNAKEQKRIVIREDESGSIAQNVANQKTDEYGEKPTDEIAQTEKSCAP